MGSSDVPEVLELHEDRVTDLMREQLGAFEDLRERFDLEDEQIAKLAGGHFQVALAHGAEAQGWSMEELMTDIRLAQAAIADTVNFDDQRAARVAWAFALYHGAKLCAHTVPKSEYDVPGTFDGEDGEDE